MNSFYSREELLQIGFKSCGGGVMISRKASIYTPDQISIGNNVRIDDFCILSGEITIGCNIHIAAYCGLYGAKGIVIEDYAGLSSRVVVYSAMDDFSGDYLIGPIQKEGTTNVQGGLVLISRFVIIGTNSTIYPGLTINEGAAIGAHTLVNKEVEAWSINVGCPVRRIGDRRKKMLELI